MRLLCLLQRDTDGRQGGPSEVKALRRVKLATARLGFNTIARGVRSAGQRVDEEQGMLELPRAYAGLVITRAASKKLRGNSSNQPRDVTRRRRRKSMIDYIATHG